MRPIAVALALSASFQAASRIGFIDSRTVPAISRKSFTSFPNQIPNATTGSSKQNPTSLPHHSRRFATFSKVSNSIHIFGLRSLPEQSHLTCDARLESGSEYPPGSRLVLLSRIARSRVDPLRLQRCSWDTSFGFCTTSFVVMAARIFQRWRQVKDQIGLGPSKKKVKLF